MINLFHNNSIPPKLWVNLSIVIFPFLAIILIMKQNDYEPMSSSPPSSSKNINIHKTNNNLNNKTNWLNLESTINSSLHPENLNAAYVYDRLKNISLDADNNIILNDSTLSILNNALENHYLQLSPEDLTQINTIIKNSLPQKASEQTIKIVNDYYQFLNARDNLYIALNSTSTLASNQMHYTELQSLRSQYLGYEAAQQLFDKSDAMADYMFEMMTLENNQMLDIENTIARQKEMTENYINRSIGVNNWQPRLAKFNLKKQQIITSNLNEKDKNLQITELMSQHFSRNELNTVRHLNIGK